MMILTRSRVGIEEGNSFYRLVKCQRGFVKNSVQGETMSLRLISIILYDLLARTNSIIIIIIRHQSLSDLD